MSEVCVGLGRRVGATSSRGKRPYYDPEERSGGGGMHSRHQFKG